MPIASPLHTRFLSALSCLAIAAGQAIPPDEIRARTTPYTPPQLALRADVRIVEVPVVVRDNRFRAISGLTRDDFEIEDNGKQQPITSFAVETFHRPDSSSASQASVTPTRPRFLAICFDDLHLLPSLLEPVKEAAEEFVKTSLAPNDRVVIVRTSRSETVQFTADVPALTQQIKSITSDIKSAANDGNMCPRLNPYEAYRIAEGKDPGNALLQAKTRECGTCSHSDRPCPEGLVTGLAQSMWARTRTITVNSLGVIDSLVDGMAKLPGQRIILLTSGGFLSGSLEADMDRLMDKALRAEVLINGLDARGLYVSSSAGMAYDGIGILASGTGGTFFHNNNSMEDGFRDLGMVPETTYLLGFAPSAAPDGKFHKLKVRLVGKKGYSVEARLGYTALPEKPASTIESEITASDTLADLPASFNWEQLPGPSGMTMIAHLDIKRLHFKPNQGRRAQRLTIIAVLVDSTGTYVAGKRSDLQLNFKDATFSELSQQGFTVALTLPAPAGNYSARAVAQDAVDNKLAASSAAVQIK